MNDNEDFDILDPQETEELENEFQEIKEPFDPKQIDIQVMQTTMSTLIDRLDHDEIDLNPDFQRGADLWDSKTKSRLIESLLVRFPIPAFYFDASDEDKWVVVDGLQRLCSIKKFVLGKKMKLNGLEILKEGFDDKTFDELPRTFKRRIDQAPVTLYLIKPGTPLEVKYSLFYRINTGGLSLNPQEIRHALNQSINSAQASLFLEKLSQLDIFKSCGRVSDKRMLDKELILRYISFKINKLDEYKGPMVKYLNDTMKKLGSAKNEELDNLQQGFENAIETAFQIWGEHAFRKSILKSNSKRKPINRALFEVATVLLSNLSNNERDTLESNANDFKNDYIDLLKDSEFHEAISIATTFEKNVKLRFDKMDQLIKKYTGAK